MKYLSAYMLSIINKKSEPTKGDVEKILQSVGIEVSQERIELLFKSLAGKDLNQVIRQGMCKLSAVSTVSAAPSVGASAVPAAEEKKVEEEEKEESDGYGGMDLFGDDESE